MNYHLNKQYLHYIREIIYYNNFVISEIAFSDMTTFKDVSVKKYLSDVQSVKPYLDYLLDNGTVKQEIVKWGNGSRNVIIIDGKKYQYKGGHDINKNLKNKIVTLYILMAAESSKEKQITSDVKDKAATTLQKIYKK